MKDVNSDIERMKQRRLQKERGGFKGQKLINIVVHVCKYPCQITHYNDFDIISSPDIKCRPPLSLPLKPFDESNQR